MFLLLQLAYGELKNEIRPTKKDLDKRISEMQEKHGELIYSYLPTLALSNFVVI